MKLRRVGTTELLLSEIGFGCGGNAGLMLRGEPAEQTRLIAHALANGITYFDNAPDYGNGVAEANLGRVLKELKASPIVNTKVEIRAENLNDIAQHIVCSVEQSLHRLQVDSVDIVQIHNGPVAERPMMQGSYYATLWLHDFMKPGGVLDGVHRILQSGKARYCGFVCRGNDAAEVKQLLRTGLFRLVNAPYSLLNPTAGGFTPLHQTGNDYGNVVSAANAAGGGVAVFSPLAGGLLTDALVAGHQTHPLARPKDIDKLQAKGDLDRARLFQEIAGQSGLRLATLAYRFILTNPGVSTLLGGFAAMEQIDDAVAASVSGSLDEQQMNAIDKIWRTP